MRKPIAVAAAVIALGVTASSASASPSGTLKQVEIGDTVTLRGSSGERMRVRAYDFQVTEDCDWLSSDIGECASVRLSVRNTGRIPLRIQYNWPRWLSVNGSWIGQNHRDTDDESSTMIATVRPGALWHYQYLSRLFDAHLSVLAQFQFTAGGTYGPYPRDRARWQLPV